MRTLRLLLLVALLVPAARAAAQTSITGTVVDGFGNARLAGVAVADAATGATVQTDGEGRFTLRCSAETTLTFTKFGYESMQRTVNRCGVSLQVRLDPKVTNLSAINVVGSAQRAAVRQPESVTTLSPQELHRSSGLFLRQSVNLTPGVRMQARTMSGGNTFTIRGYGTGDDSQNFTGSGYKAYYNGIPVTDAEGRTILDDVDFASLGRVDIIRGPGSIMYGSGIGGVVKLNTELPNELGTAISQQTQGGSYGLVHSTTRLTNVSDGATTLLSYGHQGYDSYRIHSDSRKDFGSFLGEFRPSDTQTISTFVSYANTHELRAGELDSLQFFQKLNTGEERYIQNNARQNLESFRAGVSHRYRFSDHVESAATAFYTGNTREDVYAAGINTSSNQSFGARVLFNTDVGLGSLPLNGTSGGEFQKTNSFAQGYGLSNSVRGGLRSDLSTATQQSSLFTQWALRLPADFTVTAGLSANFIEYAITDRMASSANPTHLDGSGRKTFDPVLTPRFALLKLLGSDASIYASVSQGYSPPTASDAVISYTGEPNTALDPERATQYEVGTKGHLVNGRLSYELSLFDLRVKDKLSSEAVFDTDGTVLYSYTVNAGDQSDRGLELSASYAVIDDPSKPLARLRPFMSYTYSDFKYDDFRSDNNNDANTVDYSGNRVVGVPQTMFNVGIDAGLSSGIYANVTYQYNDDLPIAYDNTRWAPSYSLLDTKLGYSGDVGSRFHINAFAGGHNLGNSLYYTQVFMNHKLDTANPHMYLPGPYKATFYGGLNLTYRP